MRQQRRIIATALIWAAVLHWLDPKAADPARPNDRDASPPIATEMTRLPDDLPPFEYIDVGPRIPNYVASEKWGTQGEAFRLMQKPLPAEESLRHMVVPAGFRVELFAAEPDLGGKPIAMAFDERGRLWVAETYDYPNELQPPGQGRDRIRICEDTTGDGRADRFTVFAEGLSIPTAIAFHRRGVIVQNGTETLYLKDHDGDGRADQRRVIFRGWNMRDTHGGVSNFQYGLDNWIWATQGYNDSQPANGERTLARFRMGFFRFRPDGSELEFIRSTNNNTWGLGISEEGLIFGSTANRHPSIYMPIANRYYEAVRGWTPSLVLESIADTHRFRPTTDRVRQMDHHGGYTAGAGHALYTARTYPSGYWNRTAFVCGPTGHLVGTFVLNREGSDFRSTSPLNLLASDDEWTAPIMAEVGPDGHVWVIDWYNYIVQHNPTPLGFVTGKGNAYETDLRDKKHGRIYRVVYEDAEPREPMTLAGASPQTLVETLKHDNMFWRRHAQRLLVERGKLDVVPDLLALVADVAVDAIGLNVGAIHALWTLEGLGAIGDEHPDAQRAVTAALAHPSAGVRHNALLVLPPSEPATRAILASGVLRDDDTHVRLAALLALAEMPADCEAGCAVAEMVTSGRALRDRWMPDAMTSAAARHDLDFLDAVTAAEPGGEKRLEIVRVVAEHYARGSPSDSVAPLVTRLSAKPPQLAAAIVRGLAAGWPADAPVDLDDHDERALMALVEHLPSDDRATLIRLGVRWGAEGMKARAADVVEQLLAAVREDARSDDARLEAAAQLVAFDPADVRIAESLLVCMTPQTPSVLAAGLIGTLSGSQSSDVGRLLVDRLATMTPAVREAAIAVLMGRAAWTEALVAALDDGRAMLGDLSLEQRQALASHPDRRLRRRAVALLERGGTLPRADREQVIAEMLFVAEQQGDPQTGREVFKKHCAKCHRHGGEGESIGPDLTGMAVHPKSELLVHILDPSRSVEGNYRAYTVVTVDGRVMTGLLAGETRTSIELFDAEGKKQTLLRDDVDELVASAASLMPEGFEKQVPPDELRDLLEFLTARGKYLPLDLSRVATITSVRGMFQDTTANAERLIFDDWSPKSFRGVPFHLVDPRGGQAANCILLHGPQGAVSARMPHSVKLKVNNPAVAIHLLGGVSGWGYPASEKGTVSLVVRLHYEDGQVEDHALENGVHFADYIRHVDVPMSELAFRLRDQQIRYLAVHPSRQEPIDTIELIKGNDRTAPVVMAVTVESP